MSVTAKDVYAVLGELLHRCQLIEWCMKFLVEQAYRKVEILSLEDLKNPPKIASMWECNSDTLGMVIKAYLKVFYGEEADDATDTDCIKITLKYSFNDDADAKVREENRQRRRSELEELLSIRNYLVHQFGLRFPLYDAKNCIDAMAYLGSAKEKLYKHFELLKREIQMFEFGRQQASSIASQTAQIAQERFRRMSELNGKVGKLKLHNFSDMASRTIYDYTNRQDVLDAILYGYGHVTPESYKSFPSEVWLAHLQFLADMSGNPNFMAAVNKQLRKIGVSTLDLIVIGSLWRFPDIYECS